MLQTAKASNQILHGRSAAVFWLSNVQKMIIKTWKNVLDSSPEWWIYCPLTLLRWTQPCLLVLWFQSSKTSQGTMSDSTSQPSSRTSRTTIFSGKFELLLRAIKHSDIHLEVPSLKSRKSFEYFFCFHQTLGISPKDLKGFKADIAFIYTALACSRALSTNLNFDLTFVTRNFIGLCIIRCAFWLVSGKDDCLERVLRKFLYQEVNWRINFEKYFIKAIENFFPVFA